MRRNLALISAAVTTFTLVVLVSVVYAYSGLAAGAASLPSNAGPSVKTIQVGPSTGRSDSAVAPVSEAQASVLSPQAAASVAAQFLHRTDLYSAELSTYNGTPAYKIAFVSGDVCYVSMGGQVLAVVPAAVPTSPSPYYGSGGGHGSGSGGSREHDGGTESEHESGDGGG